VQAGLLLRSAPDQYLASRGKLKAPTQPTTAQGPVQERRQE